MPSQNKNEHDLELVWDDFHRDRFLAGLSQSSYFGNLASLDSAALQPDPTFGDLLGGGGGGGGGGGSCTCTGNVSLYCSCYGNTV